MKYLLKIALLSVVIIPIFILEGVVSLWEFDASRMKQTKRMYKDAVKSNWRKMMGKPAHSRF